MALRGKWTHGAKAAIWSMLAAFPSAAIAADPVAPAQPAAPPVINDLSFALNVYGWASGLSGKARTLPPLPAVQISLGFDEIIKNLDGAVMAAGQVKVGRVIFFTDWVLSKISPSKQFAIRDYPFGVTLESSEVIGLAAAGYRLIEDPRYSLDLMAGARGFSMDNTLTLKDPRREIGYGKRETWFDAVGGLRLNYLIAPNWTATVIGLAGAGQSKYEWDVFGGVEYAVNQHWGVFGGFRALKVDYQDNNFIYNMLQYGPILGLHFQF